MSLALSIALSYAQARQNRKAQEYQNEVNAASVARNNYFLQRTANEAAQNIDTNLLRVAPAAEGLKQAAEIKAIQAVSQARAYAAANNIGAGSYNDVFSSIQLQVNAEEAGIQRSLLQEFQEADIQRSQLQTAADSKYLVDGSQPVSNIQTLLDFGKGVLSNTSDSDRRSLFKTVGSWFD